MKKEYEFSKMKRYKTVLDMIKDITEHNTVYIKTFLGLFPQSPSKHLEHYQHLARIYLDEYSEQQIERILFFNRRWNLKSNQGIKRVG